MGSFGKIDDITFEEHGLEEILEKLKNMGINEYGEAFIERAFQGKLTREDHNLEKEVRDRVIDALNKLEEEFVKSTSEEEGNSSICDSGNILVEHTIENIVNDGSETIENKVGYTALNGDFAFEAPPVFSPTQAIENKLGIIRRLNQTLAFSEIGLLWAEEDFNEYSNIQEV